MGSNLKILDEYAEVNTVEIEDLKGK